MNDRDYRYRFIASDKERDAMDQEDAICRGVTKAVLAIAGVAAFIGAIVFLVWLLG